jgi:hypothetical protein
MVSPRRDGTWENKRNDADRFATRLACYCARHPVALGRLAYQADTGTVTYQSDKASGLTVGAETVDALEFPARVNNTSAFPLKRGANVGDPPLRRATLGRLRSRQGSSQRIQRKDAPVTVWGLSRLLLPRNALPLLGM